MPDITYPALASVTGETVNSNPFSYQVKPRASLRTEKRAKTRNVFLLAPAKLPPYPFSLIPPHVDVLDSPQTSWQALT